MYWALRKSDNIRYSFRSKRLPSSTKEKSTEIIASSVNFESFSEDFTLYSKYRCYKNFLFTRCYFSENESREASPKDSSCKDALQFTQNLNQLLLFHNQEARQRFS